MYVRRNADKLLIIRFYVHVGKTKASYSNLRLKKTFFIIRIDIVCINSVSD